ncbi:hypothetical protein GXW83_33070 [Streptacidiphilus sp. PB12-B1b]|uniref:hypothetical protein n=1 Tax=Streptacidiphilus sp. PB12-B1b TaxID=2705012 RepID=UPI0015FDE66E|nr:hypothetical protein [Streptacidiphilus sp. PB12-B1b]QMU79815.1 hypothetical protein GXW83_33070 [Streptacidiphilus sp. PB12-B1b]
MPGPTTTDSRVCAHCDGFPTVEITTGARRLDGTRATITAHCPNCHGTGHTTPARPTLAMSGR